MVNFTLGTLKKFSIFVISRKCGKRAILLDETDELLQIVHFR